MQVSSDLMDYDWDQAFLSVWRPSGVVGQAMCDPIWVSRPGMPPQPLLVHEKHSQHMRSSTVRAECKGSAQCLVRQQRSP